MKITLTSVLVDDQGRRSPSTPTCSASRRRRHPARRAPLADGCLAEDPDGIELLLEPDGHPAASRSRMRSSPTASPSPPSRSRTCSAEYERLRGLGVRFTQEPTEMGPVTTAVFDDTCGNLIQIAAAN